MKSKYVTALLVIFFLVLITTMVFLKIQEYKLQIRTLISRLDKSQGNNYQLSVDLKTLQIKYAACTNDQMITTMFPGRNIVFNYQETGLYSPFLATRSGTMDVWDYKGNIQTEYQATLSQSNNFHILLILHQAGSPYIKKLCQNSPLDPKFSVCSVEKLYLSEFTGSNITKKGFPYYQKNTNLVFNKTAEYTTVIQLPPAAKEENRSLIISYTGNKSDSEYKQYQSLINEVDIKIY